LNLVQVLVANASTKLRAMEETNADAGRKVKQSEIAEVALRLFMERGYEQTSMALIAQSLGVAPNTLYWYFKGKDELLIAALEQMSKQVTTAFFGLGHMPLRERVTWVLDRLSQFHCMFSILQWRVAHSEAVRTWHEAWHRQAQGLFVGPMCAAGASVRQAELAATVGLFVVEGVVCHRLPEAVRADVIDWLCDAIEGKDAALSPFLKQR
jgi:TetR/AcrR family transcriptional regulator, regulator of autoinduction and epiphytic fitness